MPEPSQRAALRETIGGFVDYLVRFSAMHLVDLDFNAQDDVANVLVLVRLLAKIANSAPDAAFAKYLQSLTANTDATPKEVEALLAGFVADREHVEELRSIYCSYVVNLSISVPFHSWLVVSSRVHRHSLPT